MYNKEQLNTDIDTALKQIELNYSTNTQLCHIDRPNHISMSLRNEGQIINTIVDKSYEKSKVDGCLHKTYTPGQIKHTIKNKLIEFISIMRSNNFKVQYSDKIDYIYPDQSNAIAQTHFIDSQELIDSVIEYLRIRGLDTISIYSFGICSQLTLDGNYNMYTKCCVRFIPLSSCIGITRKINHYYNNVIRPECQKNIKDIADIHRRSKLFIKLLLKNNIEIEYLKLFVPCFLVNDRPVTARGYVIPVHEFQIKQMIRLKFVNAGAKKVIISQINICPGMYDSEWNIYLRFAVWVYIAEKEELKDQYIYLTNKTLYSNSNSNADTLNIKLTPDNNIQHIHITILKNRL